MGLPSPSFSRSLAALGALLALAGLALAGRLAATAHASPSEPFFSEYVEGSGNNKALEIYNGTGAPLTLTGTYDVQIFANGSATATATIPLTGTVADGDVFVLARESAVAAVLAQADQTTTNFLFNGNDAIALRNAGAIIDTIGQIGVDPGTEWGTGDVSTADSTLQRKAAVNAGDANGSDAFDPAGEWTGFAIDTFSGLGAHSVSGGDPGDPPGSGGPPSAVPDAIALDEDEGLTAVGVLANDSDPDGDALTVTSATDAANGDVAVLADGSDVSYAPDVDFNGIDSFTYTVSDGQGGTATATVSLTVEPVNDDPDPEDDAGSTPEDVALVIDVLANDDDVDGDGLVVMAVEGAAHGSASVSPDGRQLGYMPDLDWNGPETLEYTVSDGQGGTDTGEVEVTVTPVNDPPLAAPDVATVIAGSSIVLDVLRNDAAGPPDESGQPLAVTAVGSPSHGSAAVVASGPDAGKVLYTPDAAYSGADSFSYIASDGFDTATGLVSITVKKASTRPPCSVPPTILGTLGNDVIEGTPGDDVIRARRGHDVINGNGGNDVICAGPGADVVTTSGGDDRIAGGSGNDTIVSGAGADRVRGGFGKDRIDTGDGDDAVTAGPGDDVTDAGNGRNRVTGGAGDDQLSAGSGNDRLDGGAGVDACDADGGKNAVVRCE